MTDQEAICAIAAIAQAWHDEDDQSYDSSVDAMNDIGDILAQADTLTKELC